MLITLEQLIVVGFEPFFHEEIPDIILHVIKVEPCAVSHHRNAFFIDEELLKVPAYVTHLEWFIEQAVDGAEGHLHGWTLALKNDRGAKTLILTDLDA